jgi:hypothetical protein
MKLVLDLAEVELKKVLGVTQFRDFALESLDIGHQ